MVNTILYEYPLNERNRTFMRLEYLFNKIEYFLAADSNIEMFIIVQTFVEIINLLERNDISLDVIKELDRYQIIFSKLLDMPTINKEKLATTLQFLKIQLTNMQLNFGKHTKQLRNDEFLNLLRQKLASTNNLCSFDIPGLYYWINKKQEARQQLHAWLTELEMIKDSIKLILQLIRDSAEWSICIANCGFFQTAFKPNVQYQIVRINLPSFMQVFPEISGNKHRITVRFLHFMEDSKRPQQTNENIEFQLSSCYL